MKTTKLITALAFASTLAGAQAAITTYTQSSSFFSALSSPSYTVQATETYESYATDTEFLNGSTHGLYTYSGFPVYGPADPQGFLTGRIDDRDQPGANVGFFSVVGGTRSLASFYTETSPVLLPKVGDYFFNSDAFTVNFATGTLAIGIFFNVSTTNTPNSTDLFISTAAGTATNGGPGNFDTSVGLNDGLNTKNLYFVGLISDTPFTSAQIGQTLAGGAGWNVDNLTTATPEPTSLGLLALGMAGIAGYSRRRKQS